MARDELTLHQRWQRFDTWPTVIIVKSRSRRYEHQGWYVYGRDSLAVNGAYVSFGDAVAALRKLGW